jgi:hypothetical protein
MIPEELQVFVCKEKVKYECREEGELDNDFT